MPDDLVCVGEDFPEKMKNCTFRKASNSIRITFWEL